MARTLVKDSLWSSLDVYGSAKKKGLFSAIESVAGPNPENEPSILSAAQHLSQSYVYSCLGALQSLLLSKSWRLKFHNAMVGTSESRGFYYVLRILSLWVQLGVAWSYLQEAVNVPEAALSMQFLAIRWFLAPISISWCACTSHNSRIGGMERALDDFDQRYRQLVHYSRLPKDER